MQEFLNIALGFPTVIWTGLVGLVMFYWLFVILGALDLEFLDVHLDLDLDADLDLDLDVDMDPNLDLDVEVGGVDGDGASPFAKLAVALGIGQVPITILFTFFTLAGWAISYFGMLYIAPHASFGALGAIMLGVAFVLAVPVMGAIAHPLKDVFRMTTRDGGVELIGQTCDITTGSVTATFGQARFDDGGAGLLLSVRCETEDNNLGRQDKALIIGFDAEAHVYFVEPYEQFLRSDDDVELAMRGAAVTAEQLVNAKREG